MDWKNRLRQVILIVSFVGFSWLGMQAVHEFGHVIGAWATGGTVERVVLQPLELSRTDVYPNPSPLVVVWAGPILGVLIPLAALTLAWVAKAPALYLFRFFAGFCLIANGVYISAGAFVGIADAGVMLQHGSPRIVLVLFGLMTLPFGLLLWNGLGVSFGLGAARGRVDKYATMVSAGLVTVTIVLELLLSQT